MPQRAIQTLKVLVFLCCLIPLGLLVYQGFTNRLGPDPTATITHTTGDWALRFLLICLAVTPVRRISTSLAWLIRFRKMFGNYAFFYASLHLLTYIWLYSAFSVPAMIDDVIKRKFITVGFAAWLLMLPLALTSTSWAIRKLGGKRWQMLHRLIYVCAILGVIHYWWMVKPGVRTPMTVTLILAALLLARLLYSFLHRKPRAVLA
jgi:methionine sulfoxide reductase heme-binding subunit